MEDTVKNNYVKGIIQLLEDHKGIDTVVIDVKEDCSWADYFIITTVRSQTHLSGLINHLNLFFKENHIVPINKHKEVKDQGWVLLDCGDIIIHLMEKELREFYELEKLWFKSKIKLPAELLQS